MNEKRTPTEVRQASPRKTNFRVLIISTILTALILGGFVIAFLRATPQQQTGATVTPAHQSTTP
ncbi:MAG: hypothetical protein JSR99_04955 [Proteobacteria bacterium]|nr:hypothetical protein [Pseudomonadota bacterium]